MQQKGRQGLGRSRGAIKAPFAQSGNRKSLRPRPRSQKQRSCTSHRRRWTSRFQPLGSLGKASRQTVSLDLKESGLTFLENLGLSSGNLRCLGWKVRRLALT